MKSRIRQLAYAAMTVSTLGTGLATAANSFYAAGDLVLFVQQQSGSNTIYANLGNTATFRGTAAGSADGTSSLNIVDLSSTLTSAYGTGWASDPTIFVGLAGVWGTNETNPTLQNNDPHRTLYVSQGRASLGDIYSQNSPGYIVTTITGQGNAASNMFSMNSVLENSYTTAVAISPTSTSTIDNQNPITGSGQQGTAFGVFGGGVQQAGTAGNLGSLAGEGLGTIEFALDLYRILARNNVSGQVGGTVREGSYEGSVVLGTDGKVSFIGGISAVPEPSGALALGLIGTIAGLGYRRRRSV